MPLPGSPAESVAQHPSFNRRTALQAGAVGLLGLGMNHVAALRSEAASAPEKRDR